MHNHHRLFIAGLALLLTGLLFIGPAVSFGATTPHDDSGDTGGGGSGGDSIMAIPNKQVTIYQGNKFELFNGYILKVKKIESCGSTCVFPAGFSYVQFEILDPNNIVNDIVYTTDLLYPGSHYYYLDQYDLALRISSVGVDNSASAYIETSFENHQLAFLTDSLRVYVLKENYAEITFTTNKPSRIEVYFKASEDKGSFEKVANTNWYRTLWKTVRENLKTNTKYELYVKAYDEINDQAIQSETITFTTLDGQSEQVNKVIKIDDLKITGTTHQSAIVLWRTNMKSNGRVYYRLDSANNSTTSTSTAPQSGWLAVDDRQIRTNHEVKLSDLTAGALYSYYVVSSLEGGSASSTSETKSFTTRTIGRDEDDDEKEDRTKQNDDSDDDADEDKSQVSKPSVRPSLPEEAQLLERIKKLRLQISELEKKLLERERQLAQPVDTRLTERVKGKILLQVEDKGEAWYIDPLSGKKYYFKDGETAYQAMQAFGLGISNADISRIPVGLNSRINDQDSDHDGLSDATEEALGTDPNNIDSDGDGYTDGQEISNDYSPLGSPRLSIDTNLRDRLKGRIVIQTEDKGKAWYISPDDGRRYFLGNGQQAYRIMRFLSTGASNNDLRKIEVGSLEVSE